MIQRRNRWPSETVTVAAHGLPRLPDSYYFRSQSRSIGTWSAEPEGLAPAPLYSTLHCIKNRQAARRVVSTGPPACGWLRRARLRPPDLPVRTWTPTNFPSSSARGRGFAAYLSACGGQPFNVRCAHYARGASLTTFGFVTIVPRYLLPQVIPSHSFAALTALIVRRVNGHGAPDALHGTVAARPPEGHWRAHPAAAPCRHPAAAPCRPLISLFLAAPRWRPGAATEPAESAGGRCHPPISPSAAGRCSGRSPEPAAPPSSG